MQIIRRSSAPCGLRCMRTDTRTHRQTDRQTAILITIFCNHTRSEATVMFIISIRLVISIVIIIIIIIIVWLVLEWTLPFPRVTFICSWKTLQLRMSPAQTRASWVAQNQKNGLELPLERPNTPSRYTYLVAAYTRHVTAPSWNNEDVFLAAACVTRLPHPSPGRAVSVGPRLLDRENPAHFVANLHIPPVDRGGPTSTPRYRLREALAPASIN